MKKTILLLGATGFLGSKIKNKLQNNFKILSPNSSKLNLLNFDRIDSFFKKNNFDIIINCAWLVNSTTDDHKIRLKNYRKNLNIGNNLFFFAQKYKIKYFLNISSINTYKKTKFILSEKNLLDKKYQTNSLEGMAKLNLIKLFSKISDKKFQYLNLIFSNIYGFKTRRNLLFLDKVFHNIYLRKKFKIFLYKNFDIKIDYIYLDDAVDAVNFFLKKMIKKKINHTNINIGNGKLYSLIRLVKLIKKDKNLKIIFMKNKNHKKLSLRPSIAIAKKYNWKTKTSINSGINKTIALYKNL